MARFSVTVEQGDVVGAPRDDIWDALTDPDAVARMTPRLDRIEVQGDRWIWILRGFNALGVTIEPSFTQAMTFTPKEHIRFEHAPTSAARENAGANGEYGLSDHEQGTYLWISLTVHVDAPLPKVMNGPMTAVMRREVQKMGDGFAVNLREEVGATEGPVGVTG